jgi:hypothetical protein
MRGFCRIGQEIKGNRAGIDPVGEFDFGTGGRMLPVFFVRVRDGGDGGFYAGRERSVRDLRWSRRFSSLDLGWIAGFRFFSSIGRWFF